MVFSKAALLTGACLLGISGLVQESDARDVALHSGRNLAQLELHSEISIADPNDGNEGNEGDEGNEGSTEGDEGNDPNGDGGKPGPENPDNPIVGDDGGDGGDGGEEGPAMDDGGDQGGEDQGGEDEPEQGASMDDGGDGGEDMGGEDMGGEEEMPAEEPPAEEMPAEEMPAEEAPAEEMPEEEAPEEEDGDGDAAAAAAAGGAAAAGAAAAGAAAAGEEEEEAMAPEITPGDEADSPALAPSPDGILPRACTNLRQGLKDASPVLNSAIDLIAPIGDDNELSDALDNEELSVTVLLPSEEVLTQVAPLLTNGAAAGLTPENIREVLLVHILPEALESGELLELGDGMVETVVDGVELDMMVDGEVISFMLGNDTATVVEADLDGCAMGPDGTSVIHRIDNIFLDDSIALPPAGAPEVEVGDRGDIPGLGDDDDSSASFMSVLAPAVGSAAAAVMLFL